MNQKRSVSTILITAIFAILIVGGYFILFSKSAPGNLQLSPTPTPTEQGGYQAHTVPKFEEFSVTDTYKGTPAAIDFSSNGLAPSYKTLLGQRVLQGPNFAGHYTVVSFGCGTSCRNSLIVDLATGKVYDGIVTAGGPLSYQLNSKLIFDSEPLHRNDPAEFKEYFVMRSNGLELIYKEQSSESISTSAWKTYQNTIYNFEFKYPADVAVVAAKNDAFFINIKTPIVTAKKQQRRNNPYYWYNRLFQI